MEQNFVQCAFYVLLNVKVIYLSIFNVDMGHLKLLF